MAKRILVTNAANGPSKVRVQPTTSETALLRLLSQEMRVSQEDITGLQDSEGCAVPMDYGSLENDASYTIRVVSTANHAPSPSDTASTTQVGPSAQPTTHPQHQCQQQMLVPAASLPAWDPWSAWSTPYPQFMHFPAFPAHCMGQPLPLWGCRAGQDAPVHESSPSSQHEGDHLDPNAGSAIVEHCSEASKEVCDKDKSPRDPHTGCAIAEPCSEASKDADKSPRDFDEDSTMTPVAHFDDALDAFVAKRLQPTASADIHSMPLATFVEIPIQRGLGSGCNEDCTLWLLVQAALQCSAVVAGGAARWMASPLDEPVMPEDVDIFAPDRSCVVALDKKIKELGYTRRSRASIPENAAGLPPIGQMAVTYVNDTATGPAKNVQIVMPRRTAYLTTETTDIRQFLNSLDFTVARAAIISEKTALVDAHFEQDEKAKVLRIRHIVCPISAVRRISKYVAKGYSCNMLEIVKLFAEWSDRSRKGSDAGQGEVLPAQLLDALAGDLLPTGMPKDKSLALRGMYID